MILMVQDLSMSYLLKVPSVTMLRTNHISHTQTLGKQAKSKVQYKWARRAKAGDRRIQNLLRTLDSQVQTV